MAGSRNGCTPIPTAAEPSPGASPKTSKMQISASAKLTAEAGGRGLGGQRARRQVRGRGLGVVAARGGVVGSVRVKQRRQQLDLAAADVELAHPAAVSGQLARRA